MYLYSLLNKLLSVCNMEQTKFYFYQTNILNTLAFVITHSNSLATSYQVIDIFFPLLLLIKRQIM